jgi:hypothetical protein
MQRHMYGFFFFEYYTSALGNELSEEALPRVSKKIIFRTHCEMRTYIALFRLQIMLVWEATTSTRRGFFFGYTQKKA